MDSTTTQIRSQKTKKLIRINRKVKQSTHSWLSCSVYTRPQWGQCIHFLALQKWPLVKPETASISNGVDPIAAVHKKSQGHPSDVSESGDGGGQPLEGRPKEGQDPKGEKIQLD